MPRVSSTVLAWARETAGLTREEAVRKLDIKDARGVSAVERLASYEAGEPVTRPLLVRMAKQYRRPLVAFYMQQPPKTGDRGEDFRTLPVGQHRGDDPLVDALIRDIRARQNIVRSIMEDDEDIPSLAFIGSLKLSSGIGNAVASIRRTIAVDIVEYRAQASPESAFALLRSAVEGAGIFVLLAGNLGSHHTAIAVDSFRGFALSDRIAPFVVINDQDAKAAWSFTLLHEVTHLWLGTTGISGVFGASQIERFCDDVASSYLLSDTELGALEVSGDTDLQTAVATIGDFAKERHLSRSMVAYRLLRNGKLPEQKWRKISEAFRDEWFHTRDAQRKRDRENEGGPNYYVVRRHRLGTALLRFVSRNMSEGVLTPTKAAKILGVKPRSVEPLLRGASLSSTSQGLGVRRALPS
jgi:Zn-dependent peptidase ImmA (M78 family)